MPQVRTITETIYKFEELDERAKERAREWFRDGYLDYDWWEFTVEDFSNIAAMLGVDLKTRTVKLMGGGTRQEPEIYFDLGRGANVDFGGSWRWPTNPVEAIAGYAPQDEVLCWIAQTIETSWAKFVMRYGADEAGYLNASISKGRVELDPYDMDEGEDVPEDLLAELENALNDLAPWLLSRLQDEYDYLTSDENIDELLTINGYDFDEDGEIA